MSKTHLRITGSALALCRDAYGNSISGNEVRSMKFLAEAIKVLTAQEAALASKNDVRDLAAAEMVIAAALKAEDDFPPFDGSKIDESFSKWLKHGVKLDVLTGLDVDALSEAVPSNPA